ncbi:MAG: hypothetical protein H0T46_36810 [Deltaproteobacteria bacterium]|nr:hypothetical protein [Deltaproteobacteria bacterium]
MPHRSIALVLVVSVSLTACGAFGICQPEVPCTTPTETHNHYYEDDDDSFALVALGTLAVVALFTGIAIARSGSDDKPDAPTPKVEPKDRVVYFAPSPSIGHEGEELRLQRMYVQGQVLARAGRCEGAVAIGRNIERSSPVYFAAYAADPSIAVCYPPAVNKLSTDN